MDELSVEQVEGLLAKATPGPWVHYRDKLRPQFSTIINEVQTTGDDVAVVSWGGFDDCARPEKQHAHNAEFIAAAPSIARQLVRVMRENEELKKKVRPRIASSRDVLFSGGEPYD